MYMLWRISMVKPPLYSSSRVDFRRSGSLAHREWTFTRRDVTPLSTLKGAPASPGIRRRPRAKELKGWIVGIFENSRYVCRCQEHDSVSKDVVVSLVCGKGTRSGRGGGPFRRHLRL